MALTNPNTPVSQQDLQDFYHKIVPYMGGSDSGGGHTIEDAEGTDLTQRDTMQFGDGLSASDDSTNEKTVIEIDEMPSADMNEVASPLPGCIAGGMPTGTILNFFGESAPFGFLVCDGTTYNKADYPALSTHLLALTSHSAYEVSGDDTKFKVPDLRGEFLRGTGTNTHTNQGSGANVGVHQDGTQIPATYGDSNAICATTGNIVSADAVLSSLARDYAMKSNSDTAGTKYTSRPTNTSVLYCIKY